MNPDSSVRAQELFTQKCNCAQSVFAACAAGSNLTEAQRLALAANFGGGLAGQGEVCGALTGALLALGEAAEAQIAADPVAGRSAVNAQAGRLIHQFRTAHGSVRCSELTGHSLTTEDGRAVFHASGLRENLCTKLVAFCAGKVDEALTPAAL